MPRTYEQINQYEREVIAQMLRENASWTSIGQRLQRAASSVWREYHRNRERDGRYVAGAAHVKSLERRKITRRPGIVVGRIKAWLIKGLTGYWSPEQVHGRGIREARPVASVMTMYRFLYRPEGQAYRKYLRGPARELRIKRSRHERIHQRVMIDERPAVVSRRQQPGHWEADTVRGPMKTKACVMSVVERVTHFLVARFLKDRQSQHLNRAMKSSMRSLRFKTVTVDNGMEFASHKKLRKKTGAAVYFAHEQSPWERGLNEQVNGLLRQFFPKGTDFGSIKPARLRSAVSLINNRPRKSLNYQTPNEMMNKLLLCT